MEYDIHTLPHNYVELTYEFPASSVIQQAVELACLWRESLAACPTNYRRWGEEGRRVGDGRDRGKKENGEEVRQFL